MLNASILKNQHLAKSMSIRFMNIVAYQIKKILKTFKQKWLNGTIIRLAQVFKIAYQRKFETMIQFLNWIRAAYLYDI